MPIGHPLGFKQHPLEDAGLYEGQAINLHESTVNRCVFFFGPKIYGLYFFVSKSRLGGSAC